MWTSDAGVDVVRAAYAAFGRGDVAAIVNLLSDDVDWRFNGPKLLPYSGRFKKAEVMQWFADVAAADDMQPSSRASSSPAARTSPCSAGSAVPRSLPARCSRPNGCMSSP